MRLKRKRQCHAGWHRRRVLISSSASSQVLLISLCGEAGVLWSMIASVGDLILMYCFRQLYVFRSQLVCQRVWIVHYRPRHAYISVSVAESFRESFRGRK